jgi:hypothetical protein
LKPRGGLRAHNRAHGAQARLKPVESNESEVIGMGFNFQEISEIANIRKNARENVRLRLVRINDVPCIDARVFYHKKQTDTDQSPTTKGLCLAFPVAVAVSNALNRAVAEMQTMTGGTTESEPDAPEDYVPTPVHEKPGAPVDDLNVDEAGPF